MKLLSVIIPSYNEPDIGISVERIKDFLKMQKYRSEIIVVDDGSDQPIRKMKGVVLLRNQRNMGKGHAVRRGMLSAKGDVCAFIDADLSIPIEQLNSFISKMPEFDIVIASRKKSSSKIVRNQKIHRRLLGNAFRLLVKFLVIQEIEDTQCGFKAFNMKKCRMLFKKLSVNGFAFDVELLYLAKKHKLNIHEEGIQFLNSARTTVNPIKHSILMFIDLLGIKYRILVGRYERA